MHVQYTLRTCIHINNWWLEVGISWTTCIHINNWWLEVGTSWTPNHYIQYCTCTHMVHVHVHCNNLFLQWIVFNSQAHVLPSTGWLEHTHTSTIQKRLKEIEKNNKPMCLLHNYKSTLWIMNTSTVNTYTNSYTVLVHAYLFSIPCVEDAWGLESQENGHLVSLEVIARSLTNPLEEHKDLKTTTHTYKTSKSV